MKHPLQYITMLRGKLIACCFLVLIAGTGCRKYLEVPPPVSSIAGNDVFVNDSSSAAALNSIYGGLYLNGNFDGANGIAFLSGLYGDELINLSQNANFIAIYSNSISSSTGAIVASWITLYKQLYSVNLAIEGIKAANQSFFQGPMAWRSLFSPRFDLFLSYEYV